MSHTFTGTPGNNTFHGHGDVDIFNLIQGGNDTGFGKGGNDRYRFGATFNAQDHAYGGTGHDTVGIAGDYSGGLTVGASSLRSIEALTLGQGFDYYLTMSDGNVAADKSLLIDGHTLDATHHMSINAAAETNGAYTMIGGAASDFLLGGHGDDTFNLTFGGDDTAIGGAGADTFRLGAAFTASDTINGGLGNNDTVTLNGDTAVSFSSTTMTNIETISLTNGHSYALALNAATVAPSAVMTIDGSQLNSSHAIEIDASAVNNGGRVNILGGAGNDAVIGDTLTNSSIDMSQGGNDSVVMRSNDTTYFGAAFTAADQVTAAFPGFGLLELDGDYSAGLVLGASTVSNIAGILLDTGHDYDLTFNDAGCDSGRYFVVAFSDPASTNSMIADGSAETDASFNMEAGNGNDVLTGGAFSDTFYVRAGRDTVVAGDGDDTINAYAIGEFDASDRFNGGTGSDTLILTGNAGLDVTLKNATVQHIETINLSIGDSSHARLVFADGNVAAGDTMTVNVTLGSAQDAFGIINGAAETNGTLHLNGGNGDDQLIGGQFGNLIAGHLGADKLVGGTGEDQFDYTGIADSQGADFDHLVHFDWNNDKIHLSGHFISSIGNLEHGTVNEAHFAANIQTAIGSNLNTYEALLFKAEFGDESSKTFLVIDQNGTAGYQADSDYVIWLDQDLNQAGMDTGDFI